MTYTNNNNEVFYDFKMIAELLRVHPSYLQREMKKYSFSASDYVRYQNRHLYTQNAVIDFVIFLVKDDVSTDIRRLEAAVKKIKNTHEL